MNLTGSLEIVPREYFLDGNLIFVPENTCLINQFRLMCSFYVRGKTKVFIRVKGKNYGPWFVMSGDDYFCVEPSLMLIADEEVQFIIESLHAQALLFLSVNVKETRDLS